MKYGVFKSTFYDAIIFRTIRNMMGGNIRYFVSGGAPLNIEVKHSLVVIFSAPIFEAYG
jgi:long-chain acyl-CoA synthetase